MTDPQLEPASSPSVAPINSTSKTLDLATCAAETKPPQSEFPSDPATASQSDLPEWEPLTPELVEDEAIRGDFMLRWAIVLLTLLLGCRQLVETPALVLIKTGDYIRSHGFWPPAKDVFSFTAAERDWVNLSWLFDVLISIVHALSGPAGISLVVGMLAAVAMNWVVHVSRPQIPMWWNAVCSALALLAVETYFVPSPRIVTLLGVAWVLKQGVAWSDSRQPKYLWCLVGSLVVWSNLDNHAYVGWLLLVGWGLGALLNARLGHGQPLSRADLRKWQQACGAGLLALMVNPFGWHALASPFQWYGTEVPAMSQATARAFDLEATQWGSLFAASVWRAPSLSLIAAVIMFVIAAVTTVMNRRRVDLALLIAWLTLSVLGAVCLHDLTPAVLVACVLASLNGQEWYRATCRQEYSIATWEVVYSRVGRAATVIALVVVAYLGISGRLMGRDGKRIGVGFSPLLSATTRGTAEDFKDLRDARLFQFRVDQGDLAIWAGQQVFVDSRAGLYAKDENLLDVHEQARSAIRRPELVPGAKSKPESPLSAEDRQRLWREIFDRFHVTHVTPRLWGALPAYATYTDLATSPEWTMVRFGSTTAVFRATGQLRNDKPVDFPKRAFDECFIESPNLARLFWSKPKTGYQQFISLSGSPVSNAGQRSRHLLKLLEAVQQGRLRLTGTQSFAMAILAVRDAQSAVSEDPNNVAAYVYLADAYGVLGVIEAQICAVSGLGPPTLTRRFQAIGALRIALSLEPNNASLVAALASRYVDLQRPDLATDMMDRFNILVRAADSPTTDDLQQLRQFNEYKAKVEPLQAQIEKQIEQGLKEKFDRLQIAIGVHSQGFPRLALKLLEDDRAFLASNLPAQLRQATLLVECGRYEEASELFELLNSMGGEQIHSIEPWQLQAAMVATLRGDYDRAEAWCRQRLRTLEQATMQGILTTSPLTSPPLELLKAHSLWPFQHIASVSQTFGGVATEAGAARWTIAMCQLENARCKEAVQTLKLSLKYDHDPHVRALVAECLGMITRQRVDAQPSHEKIPILFEDGPWDPEPVPAVPDDAAVRPKPE